MQREYLIAVRCLAYNHEKTIRQCLEGLVQQKTEFPFVAIVHDDASTDGTASIIREYAEKYPDIIYPVLETENQYSKHNLKKVMDDACNQFTTVKYIAICEGDDYWIAPDKLQKQVSFLETHPEYAMCCSDAVVITSDGELDWSRSPVDTDLTIENLIKQGGLYIATAGLLYHKSIKDHYPECCRQCHVGDYPMQIWCGLQGKVRYFADKMVGYRFEFGDSWSATRKKQNIQKLIQNWKSELVMLNGLNEYSQYQYDRFFNEGILNIIVSNIGENLDDSRLILEELLKTAPQCTKYADMKTRIQFFIVKHNLLFIWRLIKKLR